MKVLTSKKKIDYLKARGIYPVEELYNGVCYYWNTKEVNRMIQRYNIENYLIKNKLY